MSKGLRTAIIVIGGMFALCIVFGIIGSLFGSDDSKTSSSDSGHQSDSAGSNKAALVSTSSAELTLLQKLENLKSGYGKYEPGQRDSPMAFQVEAAVLLAPNQMIIEGLRSPDRATKKLAGDLAAKQKAKQVKVFPQLRKAYAAFGKETMWESDIKVTSPGPSYATIEFTGAAFAANRNIKQAQEKLSEMLHLLRFKRVNYKWYAYDDEYTYYTLDTKKDGDLTD